MERENDEVDREGRGLWWRWTTPFWEKDLVWGSHLPDNWSLNTWLYWATEMGTYSWLYVPITRDALDVALDAHQYESRHNSFESSHD